MVFLFEKCGLICIWFLCSTSICVIYICIYFQEADNWTTLSKDVDEVFDSGDITKVKNVAM